MRKKISLTTRRFYSELSFDTQTLKEFGFIVGGLLLFLGIILNVSGKSSLLSSLASTVGFLLCCFGFFVPRSLKWLYCGWMFLGFVLGLIVAPVVLTLIFYLFFSPIALLKRVFTNNESWVKYDAKRTTYWQIKDHKYSPDTSKNLF